MNINMTFFIQMISFAIFVAICMKMWPVILDKISARQKEIQDSIDKANQAIKQIETSKQESELITKQAKQQAVEIVDAANKRRDQIIDKAAEEAKLEKASIIKAAEAEIQSEKNRVREELRKELSGLVVAGAQKIIEKKIDEKSESAMVDDVLKHI